MINIKQSFLTTLIVTIGLLFILSCNDDSAVINTEGEADQIFNLYLTDCPFEAEEVNVEILQVLLVDKVGNEIPLSTYSGIYNLLDFTDGVDTLLAFGEIEIDHINQIYFALGDQNTIVIDGESNALQIRGDSLVKIKINLNKIEKEDYLVDFYACTSIVKNKNGYFLKPVIKFKGDRGNRQSKEDVLEDVLEEIEKCHQLIFPISMFDQDGQIYTANDRSELIEILSTIEIKNFEYPIEVIDLEGDKITLNSLQGYNRLKDCDEKDEDEDEDDKETEIKDLVEGLIECYRFRYPIELIDDNREGYEANDDNELIEILSTYKIEKLNYPVYLTNENEDDIRINNNNQLKRVKKCD